MRVARPSFDLHLPEPEVRRAAALRDGLADFLYIPGPDFTSPLEPGLYRSTFILVMGGGQAVRVSSFIVPAFGRELCRLRLEPVQNYRPESLGSFFEPARRGLVYSMTGDRQRVASHAPDQSGWSYDGPSLDVRLGKVARVFLLTESVTRRLEGEEIGWHASRGLVLVGADGQESLLLAEPGPGENVAFLPNIGIYRALFDVSAAAPGASPVELLGYGDSPIDVVFVTAQPL